MQGKLIYEFGPFRLEPAEHRLLRQGQPINLSPQLFSLLVVFVENSGTLISKEELRNKVWGNAYVSEDALKVIIGNLRKALSDDAEESAYIETVRGRGYRFQPRVTRIQQPGTDGQSDKSRQVPLEIPIGTRTSISTKPEPEEHQPPKRNIGTATRLVLASAVLIFLLVLTLASGALSPAHEPTVVGYHQLTHNSHEQDYCLYTDGVHLYFHEWIAGKARIAEVPVAGGETVYLQTPFQDALLMGIFPGGTGLLIADRSSSPPTFWRLPVPGGSPQPLPALPSLDAAISPDGQRIAYVADHSKSIGVMNINGSDQRKLYSVSREDLSRVQWSPDGKLISFNIFDPDGGGSSGTWVPWAIELDGSHLRRLLPQELNRSIGTFGRWTPGGKYYVFDSLENGKPDLWVWPQSQGWQPFTRPRLSRLTNIPQEFLGPLVSPDGKEVFARSRQSDAELVRYDMKSGEFVPYLGGISAGSVGFSRDGQWVAYVKHPEGTLWRSRIDGTEILQLSFAPYGVDSPHWSPDGQRIAFRASPPGHVRKIFLVSRDGGAPERLIPGDENTEDGVPTWAPDGQSLVFGGLRYHPEKIAIHILDLKTRRVTKVPGSEGLWTPRWSPDGRFLLALSAEASTSLSRSILLFDFRKHKWKKLVDETVNEPVWSHDQKYIYFDQAGAPQRDGVFRVRVSDGKLERLLTLANFPRAEDRSFGEWFGLAPDDSPLLLREIRRTEIYALDVKW